VDLVSLTRRRAVVNTVRHLQLLKESTRLGNLVGARGRGGCLAVALVSVGGGDKAVWLDLVKAVASGWELTSHSITAGKEPEPRPSERS
jgi:hypothetical protein